MAEENVVQQFERLTMQLVQEAVTYFGKGVYDEEADANIRKLRTLLPVLNSAISSQVINRPFAPPQQSPPPAEPANEETSRAARRAR